MTVDLIPTGDVLGDALDLIELSTDQRSGRIGDREIVAEHPRELQSKMATAIYEVLHAGLRPSLSDHPRRPRDPEFEAALSARVTHQTTLASGTICAPVIPALAVPPSMVLVELNGIRVWVPIAAPAGVDAPPLPGTPVTVIHPAARPGLSPGFLVAHASCGFDWSGPLLRLYVHLRDASSAPAVWETALVTLEATDARYQAKILSAPGSYPRRDALVVYLSQPDWHHVPALVERLAGLAGLGEGTSLFTQELAPGVGLAFEPADPDPARRNLSFGQHRSSVLAHALFATADTGTREAVAAAFTAAHIDAERPFRNIDSPPLPFADSTGNR